MLERRVDLGRRGCRDDHVLAPCLVDAVLVFDRDRGRVEEADDQDDPCGDEQQCCRPQRVQAASGLCCALSLGAACERSERTLPWRASHNVLIYWPTRDLSRTC